MTGVDRVETMNRTFRRFGTTPRSYRARSVDESRAEFERSAACARDSVPLGWREEVPGEVGGWRRRESRPVLLTN